MSRNKIQELPLQNVRIRDPFWSKYRDRIATEVLPYQWEMMNDRIEGAQPSGCIDNFKIAAGEKEGQFAGMPFQDSDLAKWMEAAAFCLASCHNPQLEEMMDQAVDLLGRAQREDGYFDTYFLLKEPDKRWLNLKEGHELYVSGHFIEAAVAYFRATGKRKFLEIVCKNADLICDLFGGGEGQIKGCPGHQEIELALVKLFEVTGEKRYLNTAGFFLDERGKEDCENDKLHERYGGWLFTDFVKDSRYSQTHLPVRSQRTAEGHAVRAVYMYSAMADLAYYTGDNTLLEACGQLYDNIVTKRMYLTGGIGSASLGERFTCDYDLPNDTNYSESCASIGLAMFCRRMLAVTGESKYADTMETALYNTVLAGISLDGRRFFYVNPLEVWPESCAFNPSKSHVKANRQQWFACACCPPNIARTLAGLQDYAYGRKEDTLYINLFLESDVNFTAGDASVTLRIATGYPFDGAITVTVTHMEKAGAARFRLALRQPGWCGEARLTADTFTDPALGCPEREKGYILLSRDWKEGDSVTLHLEMPPHFVQANPKVRADAGKIALVRGPLVYCLESADNGGNLSAIAVNPAAEIRVSYDSELLGGAAVLEFPAKRLSEDGWEGRLYRSWQEEPERQGGGSLCFTAKAIPYCYWNNRGEGEMEVWMLRE